VSVALLVGAPAVGVGATQSDIQFGAAAQQTANNTTVQHERPDDVSESGDSQQLSQWLERRLARQLGESAVNISEGQYEQGREVLGNDYSSRLGQYVSVAGDTETDSDDQASGTYRETREDQREFANTTQSYRETYETYERARQNGNTTAARQAARELDRLSERVQSLNATLQGEYVVLANQTDLNTERPREALAETSANISAQQSRVREQTLVATNLTARTNASTVSFASPARVSGQLRLANGTALSNVSGRVVIANRSYAVTTDSEGRFAVSYRPVSLPVNATTARVQFVPTATSAYLDSADDVSVTVIQVSPRLERVTTPTGGGYGDPLTTTVVATVDGRPVPSLPIRTGLGTTVVSGRTDEAGRVTLSPRVPATPAAGERSLRVAHARSGLAVGQNGTASTVTIFETATNLTVDATSDGRLRVRGRLRTTEGAGIGGQQVQLSVGDTTRSVETNATGWYRLVVANASAIDGTDDGALAVTARFDGTGTNLRDSRDRMQVTLGSAGGGGAVAGSGDQDTMLVLGALVLGVLVVAGVVGLSQRQRGGEPVEPTTPAPESTASTTASPDQSIQWLDRARSALAAGDDERAIVAAYAAVRRQLEREAALASTLTHREFVADGRDSLSVADAEALSTVATAYERATFLGELDDAGAQAPVDAAAALLAEPDDPVT
jgi:hypothetical protein